MIMISQMVWLRLFTLVLIFSASISWLWFLVSLAQPSFDQNSCHDAHQHQHHDGNDNEICSGGSNENSNNNQTISFPSNLKQLKQLVQILSHSDSRLVFLLFCSAYLFKQTFAIPGSVFMNLLGGAIYGTWIGFPLCCLLTAIGATCCYLLSIVSGLPLLIQHYCPEKLEFFRAKIHDDDDGDATDDGADNNSNKNNMLWVLISLRLFPMTPNWFLNIASPIVGVPIGKFFISVFLGLMPYNFICVQTGSMLSKINSLDDVFTMRTFFGFLLVALVFLAPIMAKKRFTSNNVKQQRQQSSSKVKLN